MKNNTMIFKIGLWVVGVAFIAGGFYLLVSYRLEAVEVDVDACEETTTENKLELVGVKKDIGYLSEKVDRNYAIQQQILTEIKEMK